ncbi:hypothetical protein BGX31_008583, partial [Mortierella sp. GBA43]
TTNTSAMTTKMHPLNLPEILFQVGTYITIWDLDPKCGYLFRPRDMLSCIQVSRHFRDTLLPILWYIFDEEAMHTVPLDIIRKYTPYFRVHLNYGYRLDYATRAREPCAQLTEITMSWHRDRLQQRDIEYIGNNMGLRVLGGPNWFRLPRTFYSDAFNNLTQLEHLHYFSDPNHVESHQPLFQPISRTLRSLGLKSPKGSLGLQGLVFPKLKKLEMQLFDPQDALDLLQGCPNLETLGPSETSTVHDMENLVQALLSGACPKLKNLSFRVYNNGQINGFATMLEDRTGLQRLELRLGITHVRLSQAINHLAPSLTQLWIRKDWRKFPFVPFIMPIVGSCIQLKELTVEGMDMEAIDSLMSPELWGNPGTLESLKLSGRLTLRGERLVHPRGTEHQDDAQVSIEGWIVPDSRRYTSYIHGAGFLVALFQLAQEFSRLGTITINGVSYRRLEGFSQ